MPYFSTAFRTFFQELEKNNTTEWFNDNRKTYEKEVKAPFAHFIGEMISRIRPLEPGMDITPSDAITRINKDIRFSKEKTPYNTHVAANISRYGKKDKSYPGFFIQLSGDRIAVYGGAYMLDVPMLHTVRTYISGHLPEFSAISSDPLFVEKFGGLRGEQHKKAPPEFKEAAIQQPLILNRQFYYTAEPDAALLLRDELPDRLMEYYTAGKGVNDFLKEGMAEQVSNL